MNKLFSIAILALAFASCKNSGNQKVPSSIPASAPTTINVPTPGVTDTSKPVTTNTIQAAPNVQAVPATQPTTTNTGKVALNPAHGAPGHRCDIAVGAPLNSPAISTTIPATGNNNAPIMAQPQVQPLPQPLPQPAGNNNARLNPAHGQPGHDCAIPVGQPLKS